MVPAERVWPSDRAVSLSVLTMSLNITTLPVTLLGCLESSLCMVLFSLSMSFSSWLLPGTSLRIVCSPDLTSSALSS